MPFIIAYMTKEFTKYISGFERNIAQARQSGELKSSGSDLLPVEGYLELAKLALQSDCFFCHCFLVQGWNVSTRCGNTSSIKTGRNSYIC